MSLKLEIELAFSILKLMKIRDKQFGMQELKP